jgi:hypothetical protein
MQGRLDRNVTRSRHRVLALSVVTFGVFMVAAQIRSAVAKSDSSSVSSYKVTKLVGSKGPAGKRRTLTW